MAKRDDADYPRRKKVNFVILLLYLVFGLYFINFPFKFYIIPEAVTNFDPWIIFAGGVFLLFGAVNYFRAKRV